MAFPLFLGVTTALVAALIGSLDLKYLVVFACVPPSLFVSEFSIVWATIVYMVAGILTLWNAA